MIDIAAPRSVEPWCGKSSDTPVPSRVKLRVYLRNDGKCQLCERKLGPADKWVCDHVVAIVNGGGNNEANLQTICDWCDKKIKTPADIAAKSKTYRVRTRHLGIKRKTSRPMPGSRASGWKHTMSGQWVKRNGGTK